MNDIERAKNARAQAEKTTDPALYFLAADLFYQIGMTSAARRMYDRAEYYQGLEDAVLS